MAKRLGVPPGALRDGETLQALRLRVERSRRHESLHARRALGCEGGAAALRRR